MSRQPRNEPCACGSGKKYKRCHYLIDHEAVRHAEIVQRAERARELEREQNARDERLRSYGRDDNGRTPHGRALLAVLLATAVNR